ncbi:ferrous iron transport protein B [Methanoplanus endosymbiosus]|uniref:Ferrous iron transport protein B n=1 Tax=Methanoplanus endosymbiosus TaxID=33865 RepID=A0A9E7PKG9_9EURY|nr:ferrous iron transport protein B [Methanoplanus endosymbiosus]UUX91510.1 ferrous iron transport protein B [Methanoplanus endosymbiosus]
MKFALIGNPNVGKSLIFNQLTGIGVEISNFPGTTVDLCSGNVCYKKEKFEVIDFPGIYSLDGKSEEEEEVRKYLRNEHIDALIAVLDSTHLERNLYLLLQVAEYELPTVVVLNMTDEAEKQNIHIDFAELSDILGCEIIATTATEGKNIGQIIPAALQVASKIKARVPYDRHVEAGIRSLVKLSECSRLEAILTLEGINQNPELTETAETISVEIEEEHKMSVYQIMATNRHNEASKISDEVTSEKGEKKEFRFEKYLTRYFPGIPILALILLSTLLIVFFVGSFLEELIVSIFEQYAVEPLLAMGLDPLTEQVSFSFIIALQAGLGIAFPFVFVFYILISILEDSGYMTRAAFLADRAMHRIGMHGQALIPMVLGFGCNVPAVMSIRHLSKRERVIASFLITMVPCSARTVIIAGIVAVFVGVPAAISVYLIVFALIALTGVVLTKFTPGEQYGMILEMAPLRTPKAKQTLSRAWLHMKEFIFIAMPILLVSSIFLGLLQYGGIIQAFQDVFAPAMDAALGLPDYASTSLLFGILRKEMAFETLAILAGTADLGSVMTGIQLYVFAVVSVLFVPCVSTIAVLYREMGIKIAALVSAYTLTLGLVVGSLIHFIWSAL